MNGGRRSPAETLGRARAHLRPDAARRRARPARVVLVIAGRTRPVAPAETGHAALISATEALISAAQRESGAR